ncbi:hypothetical protein N0V93_009938 [Gnomoniopsis smithogilvyi]|uniref:CorA-like transporter domain-containing protein n=1 Tax=Gnomoniopsis smithogilvyi TaxID=1191159 RepID=A0A9W9CST5_9PEZI|nr:hypothetical protein N0V93_009938 [Gnomoniopsis smithogilvyi]
MIFAVQLKILFVLIKHERAMSPIYLPKLFRRSCEEHEDYPVKLVGRARYGYHLLKGCQERFQERQQRQNLFVSEPEVSVPYWDVLPTGQVAHGELRSEQDLGSLLGDEYQVVQTDPNLVANTKEDQMCRFMFLKTAGSTMPMQLTAKILKRILSYYQVMPSVLDFVYMYGSPNGKDREMRFSRFRTEMSLDNTYVDLELDALKRSGKRYQLCYNLKTIVLKERNEEKVINKEWKIRQAFFYHQFDVEKATQLWLIGDPLSAVRSWVTEHIHAQTNHQTRFGNFVASFWTSLETHLTYIRWATDEWRWHVESLEEIIEKLTDDLMDPDGWVKTEWRSGAIVIIQEREDKLRETLMALQSNADIITRLGHFYRELVEDCNFPSAHRVESQRLVKKFSGQSEEHLHDIEGQISRAQGLLTLISDRKQILIQHLQAQVAERTESLTRRQEELAKKASLEAIAVRIITVITLFYLPATFVGTFFSTDVVHYEANDSTSTSGDSSSNQPEEQRSNLALARFLQVSLPLMAITFGLAIGWYYYERRRLRKTQMWRDREFWTDSEKQ